MQNANSTWLNGCALRPRPSSGACNAGAACKRRQLLRPVRSHRWCGRERAHRIRSYSRNRMRGWRGRRWETARRPTRHWRRMGTQPASLDHVGRIPRTLLLVWTRRVLGNMGFRPRHGCRPCQGNDRDTYGSRDCRARRVWKWYGKSHSLPARRSFGARAGARRQHHRSRCFGAWRHAAMRRRISPIGTSPTS